jgi:predicted transcriptional regulator
MSKEELKQKIHRLVDEIEDEKFLNLLYEDAVEYKSSSNLEDELTEEQWAEIEEGIRHFEKGEFMTQEEMREKFRQWRNTK